MLLAESLILQSCITYTSILGIYLQLFVPEHINHGAMVHVLKIKLIGKHEQDAVVANPGPTHQGCSPLLHDRVDKVLFGEIGAISTNWPHIFRYNRFSVSFCPLTKFINV